MRTKLSLARLVVGLLLASGSAKAAEVNRQLWDTSSVVIKGTKVLKMQDAEVQAFLNTEQKHGVYLFLHGSGGLNAKIVRTLAAFTAKSGFVLIAPDYKSNYTGWYSTKDRSNWRDFIYRRASDTKDLVAYIKSLPWVDNNRIVIHGQSAGAILLADFDWGGFSAAIFTGFNCAAFNQTTIDFPKTIPALSLQDPEDPTFSTARMFHKGGATYGTCEDEMKKRPNSYVIDYSGAGHQSLYQERSIEDIQAFLKERGLIKASERSIEKSAR